MITIEDFLDKIGIHNLDRDMWEIVREESPEAEKEFESALEDYNRYGTLENTLKIYDVFHKFNMLPLGESYRYSRLVSITPIIERRAIRGKSNVLEVGCGCGTRLVFYAMNNPETNFTAIDVHPTQIDYTRKLAEENGCKNITFELGNVEDIIYKEAFNSIIAAEVMHESDYTIQYGCDGLSTCMNRYHEQIKAMSAALKRNGILTVTLFPHDENSALEDTVSYWAEQCGLKLIKDKKLNQKITVACGERTIYQTFKKCSNSCTKTL